MRKRTITDEYLKMMDNNPNVHGLTIAKIKKIKVLDWDKLKDECWYNQAMKKTGEWYCHIDEVGTGYYGDGVSDWWIGFNKKNGKVDVHFSCMEGMFSYKFSKFYDLKEINDKYDVMIQVAAIKWLNKMIDKGILGV